jgi:ABC-type Fe3+/spermidine/putrescine transport system ATPase subunit
MLEQETAGAREAARPAASGGRDTGLDLANVTKVFGTDVVAVDDVSLHIDHGEYVVLLGPSGCGKTTTLRLIGGHEEPTSGDIVLDGERLNGVPPDKRPTTTVFQHFALFPHRSVVENVEFGPKMRGISKEQRRQRALEVLEMVGLRELADRKPAALSGGQQQRVALARVLVMEPKALLLDEPLGDLDRLLRLRMRVELRNLQRQLGLMFIHVTHDQEEALSVADRIVVMWEGRIEQIGDPWTISNYPENEIVAAFMGDNNIFRGTVAAREGERLLIDGELGRLSVPADTDEGDAGTSAAVSVRSASIHVDQEAREAHGPNQMRCQISFVEYLGDLVKLHLDADGQHLLAKVAGERYPSLRDQEGSTVVISWKEEDAQLLRR